MSRLRQLPLVALVGAVLLVAGLACLAIGLTQLEPVLEGAYFDRSTGEQSQVTYAGVVDGKGWIATGGVLAAVGGALALVAAARRRS